MQLNHFLEVSGHPHRKICWPKLPVEEQNLPLPFRDDLEQAAPCLVASCSIALECGQSQLPPSDSVGVRVQRERGGGEEMLKTSVLDSSCEGGAWLLYAQRRDGIQPGT